MKNILVLLVFLTFATGGGREAFGESQKLTWDGKVTVGLVNEAQNIIDKRKTEVNTVCGILGNDSDGNEYCGPTKSVDNTQINNGFWASGDLGAHFKQSEAVTAHAVFKLNLNNEPAKAKKLYLDIDTGSGILTFGRANRPYSEALWAPDIIEFAVGPAAGVSYSSRATQITYSTGELLGPATVKLGFIQADNPGNKTDQKTESPDIEFLILFDNGQFSGGAALHSRKVNYADTTDNNKIKTLNPMTVAVSAGFSMDMVNSSLAYSTGDPVFLSGATVKPGYSVNLKDKLNSLMFQVTADLGMLSGSLFYGNEIASLSKENSHQDKSGVVNDVKEQTDTIGLRLVHSWDAVDWFAELSTTTQKYDGVVYKDARWAGAGVKASFGS